MIQNGIHPYQPTPPQLRFMESEAIEAHFAGLAGAGKTEAILLDVAQWAHIPGYNAIIFKPSYGDLMLPGSILDRAFCMWMEQPNEDTGISYDPQHLKFHFPSGATIRFAHMENELDHLRYKSTDYHYIGFDELENCRERQYAYMFSRLRKPRKGLASIPPLKMRSTSTFVEGDWPVRKFMNIHSECDITSGSLIDNPYIDQIEFLIQLKKLPLEEQRKYIPKELL